MRKVTLLTMLFFTLAAHADDADWASDRLRDTAIAMTVADWLHAVIIGVEIGALSGNVRLGLRMSW